MIRKSSKAYERNVVIMEKGSPLNMAEPAAMHAKRVGEKYGPIDPRIGKLRNIFSCNTEKVYSSFDIPEKGGDNTRLVMHALNRMRLDVPAAFFKRRYLC